VIRWFGVVFGLWHRDSMPEWVSPDELLEA